MRRLLSILAFVLLPSALAAQGDIKSAVINSTGWQIELTFDTLGTGGTYATGLSGNYEPGTGTGFLTVSSPSYNADGTTNTLSRKVWITKQVRKAYPNASSYDETISGSDVVCKFALSATVYVNDIVTGVSIPDALYTQGGHASKAYTGSVTMSSTHAYAKCVGGWSWPDRDLVGGTMRLRCVAFHKDARFGDIGMPCRVVKFTVTDGSTTQTAFVERPTVDPSMGDQTPVVEYIADISTSGFTQGAVLTANFAAYPWTGGSTEILDTADGVNAEPSANYCPQKFVCDRTGAYGQAAAGVDGVNGDDSTGAVVALASFNPASPPNLYKTIGKAVAGIQAFNNSNYGRNNPGGGIVYVKAGSYTAFWTGANDTINTPNCWVTVKRYPGLNLGDVVITAFGSSSSRTHIGNLARIEGVEWQISASPFYAVGSLGKTWLKDCKMNCSYAAPFYDCKFMVMTGSEAVRFDQGFRQYSTQDQAWYLLRGNKLNSLGDIQCFTVIGNSKTIVGSGGSGYWNIIPKRIVTPLPQNPILAFNSFKYVLATSATPFIMDYGIGTAAPSGYCGMAIVQNEIESHSTVSSPLLQCAADGSTVDLNNVLIWYNTAVGQRWNMAYNDIGSAAAYRKNWSVIGNCLDDDNIKSDTFTTENAARVGNWAQLYGVDRQGNFTGCCNNAGAAGFSHANVSSPIANGLPGLYSYQTVDSATVATTYPAFVDRKAYTGSDGAGGGTYRLTSSSPLLEWCAKRGVPCILTHDINGLARGTADPPGAHAVSNPVRGVMF